MYPIAPPYIPRLQSSSSSMILQAMSLGAPDRVPAGRTDSMASMASFPSAISPTTVDPMCITCENLSISMYFSTSTEPILDTRPRSFLPRSTSMLCSARSFSSDRSSSSSLLSSASSLPRGRVPASGKVWSTPSFSLTRVSGDAPATSMSVPEK